MSSGIYLILERNETSKWLRKPIRQQILHTRKVFRYLSFWSRAIFSIHIEMGGVEKDE